MGMRIRKLRRFVIVFAVAVTVASTLPSAQQRQRLLYAALPGVGGGNNLKYGGAGILVFDIDRGHKFVKRVPLQGTAASGVQEAIKGIAAHARTARLYISTNRRVAAYDLITDKPYKYRRTIDGQFVLYSIGWDEKDDGGVPGKSLFDEKQGDWVWQYPTK